MIALTLWVLSKNLAFLVSDVNVLENVVDLRKLNNKYISFSWQQSNSGQMFKN